MAATWQARVSGLGLAVTASLARRLASTRAATLAVTFAFCAIAVVLGLSLPTNHDEYQYVAAAHLFREMRIYADFFYSQPPYFPAFLSAWLALTDGLVASPYVASRIFNILWSILFIAALFQILFRLSPSRLFAASVGMALICVEITLLPLRVARNDMMPLALTTAALALRQAGHEQGMHRDRKPDDGIGLLGAGGNADQHARREVRRPA